MTPVVQQLSTKQPWSASYNEQHALAPDLSLGGDAAIASVAQTWQQSNTATTSVAQTWKPSGVITPSVAQAQQQNDATTASVAQT